MTIETDCGGRGSTKGLLVPWVAGACLAMMAPCEAGFTRLVAGPEPKIIAAAEAFSADFAAANILKAPGPGGRGSEYASRHLGDRTFVDFDLGRPVRLGGFRHVQRRTHDTIAAAELLFSDSPDFGQILKAVTIRHVDEPAATTLVGFDPVVARYARWRVTSVLPGRSPNVGGCGVAFFLAGETEPSPGGIGIGARAVSIIRRQDGGPVQPLRVSFEYPYAEALRATVRVEGQAERMVDLGFGSRTLDYEIPAVDTARRAAISIEADGASIASATIPLKPARPMTMYVLPHSHTDIGYTAIQTDIEEKQVNNLLQGIADARRTSGSPEGARFIWNVEVLWAADLYLGRLPETRRAEFFEAVRRGQVALNGMYLNELTGLCRPEELVRLFRRATGLGERCGVKVDSAMISDVPGYTWGTVTAMSQAGIRYFSVAPNYFDRIGDILVQWENKPFWWVGPDGESKVLVWIPFWGYAMSHRYRALTPALVEEFCDALEKREYPYDIAYVRWAGHGDNAVPDASICDFIRDWNAAHESPRFIISSTSEAFRAFESRHGDALPRVRGDWTPYWEDGAGSSAAETAMNRASSERLSQAEALWAMLDPAGYPAEKFAEAWNNVLLYSEHTWGAYCAITEPENPFTVDQWDIKRSYAAAANVQSRQRLSEAAQAGSGFEPRPPGAPIDEKPAYEIDIYNTTSWTRTGLALVPRELSLGANFVTDAGGEPVPAQRLASRELAVLVRDLPPFSGRRYTVAREGAPATGDGPKLTGAMIENGKIRVRVDEATGAIVELRAGGIDGNLVDTSGGGALNDYLYMIGDDPGGLKRNGPVTIIARDRGPLVAALMVESDAPGCHRLRREVRVVAGEGHVELIDTVDKRRLEAGDYRDRAGKESVNFGFPFNVPGGEIRLDAPLCVFRPGRDQMPSACKNWLTVGRWADVSNEDFGVTWVTVDAPLVQVGGITATLLNSQTDPEAWRKRIEPTQKLYAWVMNNHWGTNYRAYQEGPVVFRFVLRPHRGTTAAEASRFAAEFSQPLVVVPGRGRAPGGVPRLRVEPADVLVTALKPSDDRKALMVRLFGASGEAREARLTWSGPGPKRLYLSDTSERPGREVTGPVAIPAWGLVTVRAELAQ